MESVQRVAAACLRLLAQPEPADLSALPSCLHQTLCRNRSLKKKDCLCFPSGSICDVQTFTIVTPCSCTHHPWYHKTPFALAELLQDVNSRQTGLQLDLGIVKLCWAHLAREALWCCLRINRSRLTRDKGLASLREIST